jgi:SAM-dependent methyltransferase
MMSALRAIKSVAETYKCLAKDRKEGYWRGLRKKIGNWSRFWQGYWTYSDKLGATALSEETSLYPCISDWTLQTQIEPIYYYQDWWAFKLISSAKPSRHIDIGSHHKFVALLSCVVPTTFVDIRPPSLPLEGLMFEGGSILSLPFPTASLHSVSSLCVIEHIGLGRYGDPIDPSGSEKAISELKRVLAPGGRLYISVPIEKTNHTYFNAHRSFAERYLQNQLAPLEVKSKVFIHGDKLIESNPGEWCVGCYECMKVA